MIVSTVARLIFLSVLRRFCDSYRLIFLGKFSAISCSFLSSYEIRGGFKFFFLLIPKLGLSASVGRHKNLYFFDESSLTSVRQVDFLASPRLFIISSVSRTSSQFFTRQFGSIIKIERFKRFGTDFLSCIAINVAFCHNLTFKT